MTDELMKVETDPNLASVNTGNKLVCLFVQCYFPQHVARFMDVRKLWIAFCY
jgi:hypothetical protein